MADEAACQQPGQISRDRQSARGATEISASAFIRPPAGIRRDSRYHSPPSLPVGGWSWTVEIEEIVSWPIH